MSQRCAWVGSDPLMIAYHDEEWGVPLRDDRKLFEYLLLDGAQAGLSWLTIIRKREGYLQAFDNFDAAKIAKYDDAKIAQLLQNPGIIRNRQKVNSAIKNARGFLEIQQEFGGFSEYIWGFVGDGPIANTWQSDGDVPAVSPESEAMSKDLKSRGFNFVGPTIIYAFMQGAGLVNDHLVDCFRYQQVLERI